MFQETTLVTGAAGGVGSTARTAIAILLEQRNRVRALVRNLDARADALHHMGCRSPGRRHARHYRRALGHARLFFHLFHDVGFDQLS